MSWTSKPLWLEAMFVRPQHFQQAERHLKQMVELRCAAIAPYIWGWEALAVDQTTLRLGRFGLATGRGIMPDGTPFDLTGQTPPARPIAVGTADKLVFLCLPLIADQAPELSELSAGGRYRAIEMEIRDTTSPDGDVAPLRLGVLAFSLVLEGEPMDGRLALPIARIRAVGEDQSIELDDAYIPPVLHCAANLRLVELMKETAALLSSRGSVLARRMAESTIAPGNGFELALLQTINRNEPLLLSYGNGGGLHPLAFYRTLLQLAGELSTFQASRFRPAVFPAYRHDALQPTFDAVMAEIRQALTVVLDQPAVWLTLEERQYGVHVAQILDRSLLSEGQFVLAVNAALPADTVRRLFPTQTKIGPVEEIRNLVNLQLPGILLQSLPVAPRQLPFHKGFSYFELDAQSPLWEKMRSSAAFALHVSGDFPQLEIEFWAIRG